MRVYLSKETLVYGAPFNLGAPFENVTKIAAGHRLVYMEYDCGKVIAVGRKEFETLVIQDSAGAITGMIPLNVDGFVRFEMLYPAEPKIEIADPVDENLAE